MAERSEPNKNTEHGIEVGPYKVVRSLSFGEGKTIAVLQRDLEGTQITTWVTLKPGEKIVTTRASTDTLSWLSSRIRTTIPSEPLPSSILGLASMKQATLRNLQNIDPNIIRPLHESLSFAPLDGCTEEDVLAERATNPDTPLVIRQKTQQARPNVEPLLKQAIKKGNALLFSQEGDETYYLVPVTEDIAAASIIDGDPSEQNLDPKLRSRSAVLQPDSVLLVRQSNEGIRAVSAPWLKHLATEDSISTDPLLNACLTTYQTEISKPDPSKIVDDTKRLGKANTEMMKLREHLARKLIADSTSSFPQRPERIQPADLDRHKQAVYESFQDYPKLLAYVTSLAESTIEGQRKRLEHMQDAVVWNEIRVLPEKTVEAFLQHDPSDWTEMLIEYKTYAEILPNKIHTAILKAGYTLLRGESPDSNVGQQQESNHLVTTKLKELYATMLQQLYQAENIEEIEHIVERIDNPDVQREAKKALQSTRGQKENGPLLLEVVRHEVARQWARKGLEALALQIGRNNFDERLIRNIPNLDYDHAFEEVELAFIIESPLEGPYQLLLEMRHSEGRRGQYTTLQRAHRLVERSARDLHTEHDINREAIRYLSYLPSLAHEASIHLIKSVQLDDAQPLSTKTLAHELTEAKGLFDVEGMTDILREIAMLPQNATHFKEYMLAELIPQMVVLGSLQVKSGKTPGKEQQNDASAFKTALIRMIRSYNTKQLHVYSVICPPYNYEVWGDKLTPLSPTRHIDGEMLPTIGDRYPIAAKTLAHVLQGLAEASGAHITYTIQTYDGSQGTAGLWEVGEDTFTFYGNRPGGETEVSSNLQKAFAQLRQKTNEVYAVGHPYAQLHAETIGLEGTLVQQAREAYDAFINTFPDLTDLTVSMETYQAVDIFLRETLGVSSKWLEYYIAEEVAYAKDARITVKYNVLQSALREGLLYLMAQKQVVPNDSLIFGLEHTANWMTESLPLVAETLGPLGVIMARPYDPTLPYGLSLRQPFNTPRDNTGGNKKR